MASLKDYLTNLQEPLRNSSRERGRLLKFVYGKKQKVDSVELDKLFTDLQAALQKHPIVPAANIDALISEWINDILFIAGKITEEELQEAMQSFESVETAQKATGKAAEEEDEGDEDDDEE